jgi:CheY-like chemotaxis protein
MGEGLGSGWRAAIDADMAAGLRRHLPWAGILDRPFPVRPRQVERVANLAHGDAGRQNLLDLYRHRAHPAGAPTLVYFHGGAFRRAASTTPGHPPPRTMRFQLAGMRPATSPCDPEVMLRCLIVDDSPRFLDAARGLLERQGVSVVGVASNSAEALQRTGELRPDVTLLDIDLGSESGLELARRLHDQDGPAPVILISTHAEQDYAELIAASPAVGFLPKTALSGDAIRKLLAGRS